MGLDSFFLRRRCVSEKTLTRYLNAWSALEVYLRAKGIRGPAEVTSSTASNIPDGEPALIAVSCGLATGTRL